MNEQYIREKFAPISCASADNVTDKNSKHHGGKNRQNKYLSTVGFKFYPPHGTEHHQLIQLNLFTIGNHRGFLSRQWNSSSTLTPPL